VTDWRIAAKARGVDTAATPMAATLAAATRKADRTISQRRISASVLGTFA